MNVKSKLDVLNLDNGTNYKIKTLKTMGDDELLKRVFKLAYDSISYTYGVSGKRYMTDEFLENMENSGDMVLEDALDLLENSLAHRNLTGTAALVAVEDTIAELSRDDALVFIYILNRDLKINMGTTNIMKIWPDLIDNPCYMRCETFGPKTKKHISFPAILQLKADGTYREARVPETDDVSFVSRSGISYEYPTIAEDLAKFPKGYHVVGELTVEGAENRSIGNGLLNSDEVPHDKIVFEVWDLISDEEYNRARDQKKKLTKDKNKTTYAERLSKLIDVLAGNEFKHIRLIETHEVQNLEEAVSKVSEWMKAGLEGGVLKDKDGVFSSSTSKHQQKMKISFTVEARVTGFQEGTPGTKRTKTFGAMLWETDDGQIKGKTSGFSDKLLEEINADRADWIGSIIEIEANDITRGRDSDHYALSHPRFKSRRDDRTETDTLERAMATLEMAKEFR